MWAATYEASLLLFDSIWTDGQVKVNGDIVVAVPDRRRAAGDRLEEPQGPVRPARARGRSSPRKAAIRSSDKLFVYRDGRFKKFGRK